MSYEQLLLNGESITIYTEKEWFELFTNYCQKIYEERGDETGEYCCGYHWCCDECEQKYCCGCEDCVQTIIDIAKSFNIEIDRSDIDFEAFEERIKKCYENNCN